MSYCDRDNVNTWFLILTVLNRVTKYIKIIIKPNEIPEFIQTDCDMSADMTIDSEIRSVTNVSICYTYERSSDALAQNQWSIQIYYTANAIQNIINNNNSYFYFFLISYFLLINSFEILNLRPLNFWVISTFYSFLTYSNSSVI